MSRVRKGNTAALHHTARTYSNREVGGRKGEKEVEEKRKEARKEMNLSPLL